MSEQPRSRGADLTPEQLARIEAIRAANRSPEALARQAEARRQFQDKPGREELIDRGVVDGSRTTTMGALIAIHKTLAHLRRIREERGLSLTELAARSGMSISSLSRIEGGKNANFTFETVARYAAALGLDLEIAVRDPIDHPHDPAVGAIPPEVGDLLARAHRQLGVLLEALNAAPSSARS